MTAIDSTKAIPGADVLRRQFSRLLTGAAAILRPTPKETATEREIKQQQKVAREKVERYQAEFKTRTAELAGRLARDEIDPRFWRNAMLREIRFLLYTGAAAGAGGIGNLTPADLQRIDTKTQEQANYLDRWVAQLERQEKDKRSEAQIANRAAMYAGSGLQLAVETVDKNQFRQFPDLPFYPKDRTKCRTNCKCGWQWANVDKERLDADVFWRLAPAEHCQTCLKRAEACNPLKIRGGQFINMPVNMNELLD